MDPPPGNRAQEHTEVRVERRVPAKEELAHLDLVAVDERRRRRVAVRPLVVHEGEAVVGGEPIRRGKPLHGQHPEREAAPLLLLVVGERRRDELLGRRAADPAVGELAVQAVRPHEMVARLEEARAERYDRRPAPGARERNVEVHGHIAEVADDHRGEEARSEAPEARGGELPNAHHGDEEPELDEPGRQREVAHRERRGDRHGQEERRHRAREQRALGAVEGAAGSEGAQARDGRDGEREVRDHPHQLLAGEAEVDEPAVEDAREDRQDAR